MVVYGYTTAGSFQELVLSLQTCLQKPGNTYCCPVDSGDSERAGQWSERFLTGATLVLVNNIIFYNVG